MTAYYNEFDPAAAQWLRNLAAAGLITPGDIDARDIRSLTGAETLAHTRAHFFAGVAGWEEALRLAGWPESRVCWTGSCPCQPFSAAGKGLEEKDHRHLWPEFRRLISVWRPPTIFGEQVASPAGRRWVAGVRRDLEVLGYAVGIADLPACALGAPHRRRRLWWVADDNSNRRRTPRRGVTGCQPEPERGGTTCRLDDADGLQRAGQQRPSSRHGQTQDGVDEPGTARQLDDAHRVGRGKGRRDHGRHDGQQLGPAGAARQLEYSDGDGRIERRPEPSGRGTEPRCPTRDVGERGQGFQERVGYGGVQREAGRPHPGQAAELRGDAGFWSAYDLVHCRDGKARRVEPGTFPLAHGVPGRVVKLRAYGNAIVPAVSAAFIKAFLEAEEDLGR